MLAGCCVAVYDEGDPPLVVCCRWRCLSTMALQLLDRCCDGMLFGALVKCTTCGGGQLVCS